MDNTTLPVGAGGDTIRTLDKTGTGSPKTEAVALDLGGGDGRSEFLSSLPLPATLDTPVDDDGNPLTTLSQPTMDQFEILFRQTIASAGYPQTQAEINAAITPVNPGWQEIEVINVLRYGIVPNNQAAAGTNTTALKALLLPSPLTTNGPTGRLIFPNTTGADTYYFNDIIQVRDGIRMDLCGSTINFSKTWAPADNTMGFFTFIRDVTIENGSISVNYDGTLGVNAGAIIRMGSRPGYAWAGYNNGSNAPTGIFDLDTFVANGLPPMGNLTLRNLRFSTTNPFAGASAMILMYGGLQNVLLENLVLNGVSTGPAYGIAYEFGQASTNGFPTVQQHWSSSHAHGMVLRNIIVKNLNTSSQGYAVDIAEAYDVLAENIHSDTCGGTFSYRIGEAHFFRPWAADATGAKRCCVVRNITSQGAVFTALNLNGSQPTTTGYLSDANMTAAGLAVLTPTQKVDLMHFSLDGFSVDNTVAVDGPVTMRNGTASGGANPIYLQAECTYFSLENIEALNGTGVGIRANDASTLFARNRIGTIRNCKVAGNTGAGISLANTESMRIENCQLGFNTAYDATNEATQTDGVSADVTGAGAGGIICRGNYVTVSGAGVGYHLIGTPATPCAFWAGKNTITSTGSWVNGASSQVLYNLSNEITAASGITYSSGGNVTISPPSSGTALTVSGASGANTISANGFTVAAAGNVTIAAPTSGDSLTITTTSGGANNILTLSGSAALRLLIGMGRTAREAYYGIEPTGGGSIISGTLAADYSFANSVGNINFSTDNGSSIAVRVGNATLGAWLTIKAGTASVEPLLFTSGTNLTTAVAGAVEYDGTCKYFSPAASSRAVDVAEYIEVISSAYTLTSQTAAQKLLNATTNGAVTLPIGTYEFECMFSLTSLNTGTSSIFGFALGGAATFTQAWWAHAVGAALATASTVTGTFNTAANVAIVAANTSGNGHAIIKGIIRVTVAGTVIPQVSLNTAAAAVVGTNSYFRAWPVGNGTVTNVGNWS